MLNRFSRTEVLIGKDSLEKLKNAKVAIFGIGGVGSYVLEGLVRAGVGNFVLVDKDDVDITNINRQIIATTSTIGKPKVEVAKSRALDINPDINIQIYKTRKSEILTYIVDAVDNVTAKIELAVRADKLNIPIISSMGTGNKLDNTKFEITDISKTSVCPLAKVIRKELRKRNIKKLKVVYSKEEPIKVKNIDTKTGKNTPGSVSFVPSVAGLTIAGEIVKDILKMK